MKSPQSLGRSRPSPLHLGWARYPSKENGFQNANSSSKDKSWSHCQLLLRLPQPYNCHLHSEGLVWSYAGSYTVRLESQLPLAQVSCFCGYLNQFLNWGVGRLQSKPRESFRPREWWVAVFFLLWSLGINFPFCDDRAEWDTHQTEPVEWLRALLGFCFENIICRISTVSSPQGNICKLLSRHIMYNLYGPEV